MSDDTAGKITVPLSGRIDSNNAQLVEDGIRAALSAHPGCAPVLDATGLEYVSSAGLRVLLRLNKEYPGLSIINVGSEVYEVLEMTGFTEMLSVQKAFRVISIDGCEQIGSGANGAVYRLDDENIVKVYFYPGAPDEITLERENAKTAFVLGLPTAIPYDVVRVGDNYGAVYELLNASSFSKLIAGHPEELDRYADEFAGLLKKIHGTDVPEGRLPEMKPTVLQWVEGVSPYLPEPESKKLFELVQAVPPSRRMLHGDYHTKNLMVQNGEVMLIDMDTLSVGNEIFEWAPIYNAFIGFYEVDHDAIKRFQGFDFETGRRFYEAALSAYLGTKCPAKLGEVTDKARILSYARLISRTVRHGGLETELGRREIEHWRGELIDLLGRYDTLTFGRCDITLQAERANLPQALEFVHERTAELEPDVKTQMQLDLAVEELFVNIADYAYAPGRGSVLLRVQADAETGAVSVTFEDGGVPYDPLKAPDPDITLSADEREPGGLGVFLTKQIVSSAEYRYSGGKNILTIHKNTRG